MTRIVYFQLSRSLPSGTLDLGVCMKAYPLVSNSQEHCKNHIIIISIFHFIMVYFKMIGKKNGCFSYIFLEAGMITAGSITGIMNA